MSLLFDFFTDHKASVALLNFNVLEQLQVFGIVLCNFHIDIDESFVRFLNSMIYDSAGN